MREAVAAAECCGDESCVAGNATVRCACLLQASNSPFFVSATGLTTPHCSSSQDSADDSTAVAGSSLHDVASSLKEGINCQLERVKWTKGHGRQG